MHRLGIVAICVTLAACTRAGPSRAPGTDPDTGLRVTGNETSVIIGGTASEAVAFPIAERHCASYGKVAYFSRMDGFRVAFDCEQSGR
jgi:hypothetical protein